MCVGKSSSECWFLTTYSKIVEIGETHPFLNNYQTFLDVVKFESTLPNITRDARFGKMKERATKRTVKHRWRGLMSRPTSPSGAAQLRQTSLNANYVSVCKGQRVATGRGVERWIAEIGETRGEGYLQFQCRLRPRPSLFLPPPPPFRARSSVRVRPFAPPTRATLAWLPPPFLATECPMKDGNSRARPWRGRSRAPRLSLSLSLSLSLVGSSTEVCRSRSFVGRTSPLPATSRLVSMKIARFDGKLMETEIWWKHSSRLYYREHVSLERKKFELPIYLPAREQRVVI